MTTWTTQNDQSTVWADESDMSASWSAQSDQSISWANVITDGYVELGYVDYIYVEGELISYAVDDANNSWTEQSDAVTTWQL